jgi:ABC-2 type transport system permease protein
MLEDINSPVPVERIMLDENLNEDEEFLEIIATIILLMFILPVFMLIMTVTQMIGAEINEEKSSKGMEIIISSVSPRTHFISKLVAANLFAFLQGLLLLVYGFIGCIIKLIITGSVNLSGSLETLVGTSDLENGTEFITSIMNSGLIEKLSNGIPVIILIIILTFIAYTLFIGILASVTTSMEDFNQIQTPVMMFLMAGYMLSIYAALFKGSLFLKVMSFIPLVSGILSPVMYMLGELTLLELWISISLLVCTILLLYKYGLRVYKVGILNYSSTNLWKKIFNALKTRD